MNENKRQGPIGIPSLRTPLGPELISIVQAKSWSRYVAGDFGIELSALPATLHA
jgi:hypothetical protein